MRKSFAVSSNISSSSDPGASHVEDKLKVYYCHCGEWILINGAADFGFPFSFTDTHIHPAIADSPPANN